MKHMIYCLILIIYFDYTFSQECDMLVRCANPQNEPGICLKRTVREDINYYNFTHCAGEQKCEKTEVTGEEVQLKCVDKSKLPRKNNLYDGQECYENKQCFSANCTNNICVGKRNGEKCGNTDECATRHYCKPAKNPGPERYFDLDDITELDSESLSSIEAGGICSPQEKIGDPCQTEFDCANNATCGPGNQCAEYFTFEDGEKTDKNYLCKSTFVGKKNGESVCVSYKRAEKEDECKEAQTECKYVSADDSKDVKSVSFPCKCSIAVANKKFCPIDPSGAEYQKYLTTLKEFFKSETHDYHTKLRYDSVDPVLRRKFFIIREYPKFRGADSCAIDFSMSSPYIYSSLTLLGIIISLIIA